LKVDGRPYYQEGAGKSFTRAFSFSDESSEFKWHRDENRRVVSVISGDGWKFQFDNSIPFKISPGDLIVISANCWHRIIPGVSDLVIKIDED
jgi:mannose-6-phosphate isomerase-like protein (cupin superfamily)